MVILQSRNFRNTVNRHPLWTQYWSLRILTTFIAERLRGLQFSLKPRILVASTLMAIDALSHLMYTKSTATPPTCTAVTRIRSIAEYFILYRPLRCLHRLKLMHPRPQLLTIKALNKGSVMCQFVPSVAQTWNPTACSLMRHTQSTTIVSILSKISSINLTAW